jgi:hypothetical protein
MMFDTACVSPESTGYFRERAEAAHWRTIGPRSTLAGQTTARPRSAPPLQPRQADADEHNGERPTLVQTPA